jgi:hypothetical protein
MHPWMLLMSPIFGYVTYFFFMYFSTGNSLEGFAAQAAYPNSPSIKNIFLISGFLGALANVQTWDGMVDSALDRLFFIWVLVLLPMIYRLDKTWFWYTLPVGVIPALTSWFMSYRRYVVVLFPVFVVLAQLLRRTNNRVLLLVHGGGSGGATSLGGETVRELQLGRVAQRGVQIADCRMRNATKC